LLVSQYQAQVAAVKMRILSIVLFAILCPGPLVAEWTQLPSLPEKEGFAGSFAGVSHGALIVAGGANFPDKKPWEGGTKVWYDTVFVLERPNGEWRIAGRLPRRLGYGVSVTYRGGVVCVGGSDRDRHYSDAFRLDWRNGKLVTTKLPAAPQSVANSCGALVGDVLYVAGGLEKPDATRTIKNVWQINLAAAEPKWKDVAVFPGRGRMLSVAAGFDAAFWLIGGANLTVGRNGKVERHYLRDGYRYDPHKGWTRIADLSYPVAAAPTPAPVDESGFYILGGDDGSQVELAPEKHRGFGSVMLRYTLTKKTWIEAGRVPAPRATAPTVQWDESWIVPGGEVRPGIRSSDVWRWTPEKAE
jgi:N-acetylneuraminate epimerase